MKWVVIKVCLFSLLQDHSIILTPLTTQLPNELLIFYYRDGCPFANQVHSLLLDWVDQHESMGLTTRQATEQFPSPTLRIPVEDFYINYIGVKAIKEAIKTTIFY
jgi:hypothetical protein